MPSSPTAKPDDGVKADTDSIEMQQKRTARGSCQEPGAAAALARLFVRTRRLPQPRDRSQSSPAAFNVHVAMQQQLHSQPQPSAAVQPAANQHTHIALDHLYVTVRFTDGECPRCCKRMLLWCRYLVYALHIINIVFHRILTEFQV